MEYYFSDRSYNIIGMASTTLKDAIRIYDDLEAEDIDSGLSSFEGKIYFTDDKDGNIDVVTEMCQKGNYILYRNRLGKDRFFTIIETEKDRKENSISFYAEDGGLDLINEVVGPFESTTTQPASFYLEEFLKDSGFTIGLNEIVNLSRKLKWEGESSVTSRIRSVATQFDNAEISFSFEIEGMVVSEKKVNIHKKRGNETNETLTLGKEIDNIKTIESIENLATSLLPKGGTPEGENAVPIDLKGYVYDDGRFYVNKDGFIRDREARTIWNRFSTTPSDDTGFINKPFSYDTLSKSELLNRAIGKLKEISKPDQNFIVDIITLPDNVSLGDRINIVDERDDLNLSTRVLKLEIEEGINKCTALLGEFIIKQKTIGEKLQDIADNLKDNMKPGDTYYPSVAYADDDEGNGFSISPDNKAYIAIIYQKNNSIPSTNPKDYEGQWIHIKGLNGDRGEDGLPGKDGVGLKSTTITYAYNKSSLNPPTSGWTSDVPQTPPGDYLWTRTIWKYTDNKEETGYSVSRIGKDGNTGNDGIAGKDGVGLKSTSVNYASSSSGTIIPTSGWSLNIPEVPTGQFLWTRTIWTYTDNTNERGYSVSRMGLNGTNGNDGIAGKDGVGLKRTTIRYAASENGITPPVIWYADIPSVPPGQYLWTQTTWLYTDDTKETGYSVSKIGEDGMKGDDGIAGKDGVGIESTNIQYTASSDGKNPPTTGWTDQIPIVTPGKFLWTRTVWTYTDGTNETGYSISKIGEDGTDGIAGKDGFGLKSTFITYAGSTSGTTTPSSGWSNNVPAVPAGNYLWTKTTWVYTDNTNETGYTVSRIGKDGNTGKDGIAGKDGVGIKSTAITYVSSPSGTGTPTGGWTESIPTVPPGQYLWTKTIWTYSDNTTETGYSVARSGKDGNTGKDGIAGKDGKGITSTTITYGLSTTDTVEPTKYTSNVPTLAKGQYLWTKTVWKYTDNTTETGYTKTYIAKDGNTGKDGIAGKDGVGISKTTITYAKSTNGTTAPTTGYTTTVPSTNPGDYLWTKTVWTYTDNTNETGYSVGKIGNTGATGAQGPQGVQGLQGPQGNQGIKGDIGATGKPSYTHIAYATGNQGQSFNHSTFEQATYVGMYVSDNQNSSGNWRDYQWTLIRGRDGSKGLQGPEGIGGITPYFHTAYANSADGTVGFSVDNSSNKEYIGQYTSYARTGRGRNLLTGTSAEWTTKQHQGSHFNVYLNVSFEELGLKIGEQFTVSLVGKSLSDTYAIALRVEWFSNNNSRTTQHLGQPFFEETRCIETFTVPSNYTNLRILFNGDPNNALVWFNYAVKELKIEKGTEVTPYGVAPEDAMQDSTNPEDYSWTKIKGDKGDTGAQGPQGIQGPAGTNGTSQYVHIRYSANSNGSDMTPTPQSNTQYIGLANTTSATAPTVNTSYTWTKTKGETGAQGNQGIQGPAGVNGQTTYTWVKYADTNTGTEMNDSPDGKLYIGLAFNKTTATESNTASDYTWSLMPQNIEVGGENLINGTAGGDKGFFKDFTNITDEYAELTLKSKNQYTYIDISEFFSINGKDYIQGDKYIWSYEIMYTSWNFPTGTSRQELWMGQRYQGVSWTPITRHNLPVVGQNGVELNKWYKNQAIVTIPANRDDGSTTAGRIQFYNPNPDIEASFTMRIKLKTLKLEKGNTPTDWTPAPEDARTYKAWANSSDGTVDFTRVYPNENLWIDSLSESGYESSGNVIPSTDIHRIMPELVPVDGTEIVYQFWNPNKVVNRSNANRIAFLREDKTFISHITNRLNGETYKSEPISLPSGTKYLRIGFIQGTPTDRDMAIKFKVEVGTTPTIYTTNTTDSLTGSMMQYIGFSPLDSNNPSEYQWIINPEYTKALSDEATNRALENINESLEDKVAREEYAKLEQLATEFAKSYEAFISEGGRYLEDAAALEDRFTQIFLELGANTLDLQFLNTYFRAGEEGLLIGSEDSQIKMLLTNNRLSFQEGVGANAKEIAYFGGQSFIINSGAIVQDFQIGEHKFTNIGGGRTIVQWVTK